MASSHENAEDAPSKEEAEVSKDHQISTPLPKKPPSKEEAEVSEAEVSKDHQIDQVPAPSHHSLLLQHSTKPQLCSSSTTSQEMASSHENAEDAPSKEEAEVSKDHQISTPLPKKPPSKEEAEVSEAEVSKDHQISTPLPKKPAAQNQPQIPKIKLVEKDPPSKSAAKHGSHMAKRKASNIEVETAKEKKDVKKRLLFTEGDDIVILESMIEYRSKTGLEPRSNIKGFLEFVNKSLSFAGATPTQLYEKVRRLQEKYEKNARGENRRVFVKPHEEKIFELSKNIWENKDGGNGLGNENVWKMSQRGSMGLRKEGQKRMRVDMGSVQIVKDVLEVISESKKVELEGKWKELMVDEIEHYLKKLDLISEQMMLVLEAMKLYGS